MTQLSIQVPPASVERDLSEYLLRMFNALAIESDAEARFVPRYTMPSTYIVGAVYYFGSSVAPDITEEGLWVFKTTGWKLIA